MEGGFGLLEKQWKQYMHSGNLDTNLVRPLIISSWERCRAATVDEYDGKCYRLAEDDIFGSKESDILIEVATPLMESVYECIKGTGFMAALVNKNGFILKVIGDFQVIKRAEDLNFAVGSDWREESVGTNAMGTCLVSGRPVQVNGPEHFCQKHHPWTCSSAPIYGPSGVIAGCLNLSGPWEKRHPHTLGMVIAKALAIQNLLLERQAKKELRLSRSRFTTVMNTVSEGILSVDSKGMLVGASPSASDILGLAPEAMMGKKIGSLLKGLGDFNEILRLSQDGNNGKHFIETPNGRLSCVVSSDTTGDMREQSGGALVILKAESLTNTKLARMGANKSEFCFDDIIGESKSLQSAKEMAMKISASDSTVLVLGESGTGKELFAQAIHNTGKRKYAPFVPVNCGGLPSTLIQSELFGYCSGAFTGARRGGQAGKFECANGGTIFLDEIGDMPEVLQANFLRVLEERSVVRVGTSVEVPVDVRVITATNKNLQEMVKKGSFRKDLFYRVNVVMIELCPLRERIEDLQLLTDHFLDALSSKLANRVKRIDDAALEIMMKHQWPGNVRELRNVIEHSIHITEGDTIKSGSLPKYLLDEKIQSSTISVRAGTLKDLEIKAIIQTLKNYEGNISKTAMALGINRNTLYDKMKKYNISNSFHR